MNLGVERNPSTSRPYAHPRWLPTDSLCCASTVAPGIPSSIQLPLLELHAEEMELLQLFMWERKERPIQHFAMNNDIKECWKTLCRLSVPPFPAGGMSGCFIPSQPLLSMREWVACRELGWGGCHWGALTFLEPCGHNLIQLDDPRHRTKRGLELGYTRGGVGQSSTRAGWGNCLWSRGWWDSGTSWPEKLWMSHPWKYSRLCWTGHSVRHGMA